MPDHEKERLKELHRFAILESPPEARFDRITGLAARLFRVPIAVVSLVDEHRQWFQSRRGTALQETPRDISFCTHAIQDDQVMVVPDAASDPRFASSPLVTGEAHVRFYAGAPLITSAGFRVGALCLMDTAPRSPLTADEMANLADLAGMVVDELELRQTEAALGESHQRLAQLAAIIDSSDDAIIGRTFEGVITSWNAGAERIFGYTAAEVIGRPVSLLVPESMPSELVLLGEKLQRGERVAGYECTRVRKDGSRIQVSITLSPIKDDRGNITSVSAIARDITERKLLEEQLVHSQKMEAVALLAGGVAHDFNNLLTIIIGYGRMLLLEAAESSDAHEYTGEILYSAERASALTGQLLAFSRKQVIQPRVLDLNNVLESMHKFLVRILGEHIELRALPGSDLGRVKADPGHIEQVIANLAVNARDAMMRGGKLTIETANVELNESYSRLHPQVRAGSYVMLAVSDTGSGMRPEVQKRIFEPFFTTKDKGKGTGLGLSIIHGIVKQSGGEIWVYSEPGSGTTFKIYLPRVFAAADSWKRAETGSAMPRGSETVLVVEDENSVQKMVREILTKLGYTVLVAGDGQAALEVCGAHPQPIQLLVTDVVMPGMAGPDLARAVRILRPETKVIFMSGYTENSMLTHDVLEPDANFLQKPFTPEEFAQRVREVLDRGE